MNDKRLLALYGLKYHPFLPRLPQEALYPWPGVETFARRVEALVAQGGFALLTGESGLGKSKALELLSHRLARLPDLTVGVMERPQSRLADFYRELGELFAVPLTPLNRYGGFKALRTRWQAHCETTLFRPVLLIDEAQEVSADCLTELRLLQSTRFDSDSLLFTVLCGDQRLPERFRTAELRPLGSRLRTRLHLVAFLPEELRAYLDFALAQAGAPHLFSPELAQTLCAHAGGNLRVLTHLAAELLATAAERDLARIDEALFLELFVPSPKPRRLRPHDPGRPS